MKYQTLKSLELPNNPGVYFFVGKKSGKEEILYIGKAGSLSDRVKSYFSNDILKNRGLHISNMVTIADTVKYIETDSTLEALLLENRLIKKWKPKYNTKEKDNKSFNYVIITREKFPRVLIIRGRNILADKDVRKAKYVFGPFPLGILLKDAMKIIRKIFPYRDKCFPPLKEEKGRPCFDAQINLCPGVCTGEMSEKEYAKRIQEIKLFFEGKKKEILRSLEKEMRIYARMFLFEKAYDIKKRIFALNHIKDISLIKDTQKDSLTDKTFRIESYDVAHISGTSRVGVMTVIENGEVNKNEYRKFKLRSKGLGDTHGLEEIIERRLKHKEWMFPNLVVVDGGTAQMKIALKKIKNNGFNIPVVAVVKDDRHKPKGILGPHKYVDNYERDILLANSESHRFAVAFHRDRRSRVLKVNKNKTSH